MKSNKGFTLIELLIVIAIIGVLASIIIVSVNSARAKSRNVRRLSDINSLITGFNLAYSAVGSYPSSAGGNGNFACISTSCYERWSPYTAVPAVTNFLSAYVPTPTDPAGGRGFGGFLYQGPVPNPGYVSGSQTIPPGTSILNWMMEPGGTCGRGIVWSTGSGYIECMYVFK